MREISFGEYLKHFFTKVDVINNEILNTLENNLSDVLLTIIGVFFIAISFVALFSNFFMKDKDDFKKDYDGSYFGLFLFLFGIGLCSILCVMNNKVYSYNELVKSIPDEKYVYLAYTKDFIIKDDINEAVEYMRKKSDIHTVKFYAELNSKRDSFKVKELISLIDMSTNDGIVTIFEFNKIQENLKELEDTYISTSKEIEKVKTNLRINIK